MRGKEAQLQDTIIRWLKRQGCVAVKYQQNATTVASIPDILFWKEQFWGWIEVKASKTAKFRPGQKERIEWAKENSWGAVVWPDNWSDIQDELKELLK